MDSSNYQLPTPPRSGPKHPSLRRELSLGSRFSGLPTPRPSPVSPSSSSRKPSPTTPSHRVAAETSQVARSNLTPTQSRRDTMSARASADASRPPRQHLTANAIPRRPATAEALLGHRPSLLAPSWDPRSRCVSQPQQSPVKPEPVTAHQRSDSSSSEYSQTSTDSGSRYSGEGASITTSLAEAIAQGQEERRRAQQSRVAYMRQSATSSVGRQSSQGSHSSSSTTESLPEPASPTSTGEDYQTDVKTSASLDGFSRADVVPTINVLPPSRKPVPPADAVSINSQPTELEPRRSLPGLPVIRASVSAHSLKSLQPHVERPRKRKPGKIVISHPHLNESNLLGAEVLPKGTVVGSANTALFEDGRPHMLVHSKSLASLKTNKLVTSKEKSKKAPKPPFDKHGMPSEEQLKMVSV